MKYISHLHIDTKKRVDPNEYPVKKDTFEVDTFKTIEELVGDVVANYDNVDLTPLFSKLLKRYSNSFDEEKIALDLLKHMRPQYNRSGQACLTVAIDAIQDYA